MPSFRRLRGRSPTTQCFLRLLEPAQFELLALDGTGFLGTGLDLFSRGPHTGQQVTGQSTHAVGPYEDIAAGGLGLAGGIVEFVLRIQHVQQAARAQQELVMVGLTGVGIVFHRLGIELVLFLGRQIVAPGGLHVQAQGVHVIVQVLPGFALPRRCGTDAFHVGTAEELAGKSPGELFPQEAARKLQAGIERKIKEPSFDGVELALPGPDGKEHLYRVSLYVFLDRQEQEAAKEAPLPGSVVAIFKDITRFRKQAQKAQERQQHLMEALVRAVEYVDPNLVGHTRKMRHVAELLARHMELDDTAVLTLRMASQLSQIGKIFVPHHLLRKSGKLTPEEQQAVLQSSEYAFRVLYGINFGLPVPEALHDMNEKFDGSGPRALKGDQINPHARLLAVVNAFCSMVSDRAYRQGMPIEQALDILSSSPAFDPAMVLALREIPADDLRSALAGEDAPSRA